MAAEAVRCLQRFFRRKIAIPRTTERRPHRRTQARVIPDDDTRIAASDAWRLTLEEQLQDPPLRVVHESITASSAAMLAWSEARRRLSFSHDDYTLHRARIFYKALDSLRLVVPVSHRFALLQAYTIGYCLWVGIEVQI
eukprot:5760459-Pleurochrysis_carterae.AAC.1